MKPTVLLVGEGNFSFAASFISTFNGNIIASCYESNDQLTIQQKENITKIKCLGGTVLTGVDATELHINKSIAGMRLSRIQFNFPHARNKNNIKANRLLLQEFFDSCSRLVISQNQGFDVWVTLCAGQGGTDADGKNKRDWNNSWKIVQQATEAGFLLKKCVPFESENYPSYCSSGYRNKEKDFKLKEAIIHIFHIGEPVEIPKMTLVGILNLDNEKYLLPTFYLKKMSRSLLLDKETPVFKTLDVLIQNMNEVDLSFERFLYSENIIEYSTNDEITSNISDQLSKCTLKSIDTFSEIIFKSKPAQALGKLCAEVIFTNNDISSFAISPVQHHVILNILSDKKHVDWLEILGKTLSGKPVKLESIESSSSSTIWENASMLLNSKLRSNEIIAMKYLKVNLDAEPRDSSVLNMEEIIGVLCEYKQEINIRGYCLWLSIDTLACIRYNIFDSRKLWSKQAKIEDLVYIPNSIFSMQYDHDISFWVPDESSIFNQNFMILLLRSYLGDILKNVKLLEKFKDKENCRISFLYRFSYNAVDSILTKSQCSGIQIMVRNMLVKKMGLMLR